MMQRVRAIRRRPLLFLVFGALAVASCSPAGHPDPYGNPPPDSFMAAHIDTATADGGDVSVDGALVSLAFFEAANLQHPGLGRIFVKEDYAADAVPVALISHPWWKERFKESPEVIGTAVRIDGRDTRVVGVLPPGFDFPSGAAIWLPRMPR